MRYVVRGKASSAIITYGKGTSLPGRDVGGGRSALPEARSAANSEFLHTPPSLIEPVNYLKYTPCNVIINLFSTSY